MSKEAQMKLHASLEAYEASTGQAHPKKPPSEDPLANFIRAGWFATGHIQTFTDGRSPLPYTVHVLTEHEARQQARNGWRPLVANDGSPGVPPKIVELFRAYYKGKEPPEDVAELFRASEPPKPPEQPKADGGKPAK